MCSSDLTRVVAACVGGSSDHVSVEVGKDPRGTVACYPGSEVGSSDNAHVVATDVTASGGFGSSDVEIDLDSTTARVGVAYYEQDARQNVLNQQISTLRLFGGHAYRLVKASTAPIGADGVFTTDVPDDGNNLLMTSIGPGSYDCTVLRDDQPAGTCLGGNGGTLGLVAAGTVKTVTLQFSRRSELVAQQLQAGVLFYEQVD